ncbi:anti-phage ZorAB system protein ZorA [Pseudomonas sp. AN-1]|uniref:anti-phage ZorAB system protein ZorA n=1 Tax=Pseudomonas sp. AN-1 TaxID=3096605 RepID=UPI002A6AAF63|nr:anti-phage ZorAB system protein ZorA [Pseudomonas sp. AN-1]WPP45881.1 anti-phage ZorAB system protein ZorA [Pseudomonas sp. AN-1]
MLDLLSYLWPDFFSLKTAAANNTDALSALFCLLIGGLFLIALFFVAGHYWLSFKRRLNALKSLLQDQSRDNLAINRRDILQRAKGLKPKGIGELWQAFDESLATASDNRRLFNTLDAEHFFNAGSLAPEITGSRLLAAAPGFLVAIGVLGTFVGLTVGLVGLQLTEQADVNQLKGGIHNLIAGAAVAFMTSVWGVGASLLLNFIEKLAERFVLSNVRALQARIDELYPMHPAEQSLLHIAEYSKESTQALRGLDERIGNRLQESIKGMSDEMQEAITKALNSIMKPAIQTLIDSTSKQSSEVLETLVGRFMDGMTAAGREQGYLMQQAATDVHSAVGGMGERINQLAHTLGEQQNRQLASAEQQRQQFEAQLERITRAAEERQEQMERRFGELMRGLGGQLDSQLGAAQRRDEERQALFERLLTDTRASQAELLEKFTQSTREQMQAMGEASNERHTNLERVFSRLMINLNTQLEAQMNTAEQREQKRAARHQEQQSTALEQQRQLLDSLGQTGREQIVTIAETSAAQQRKLEETVGKLLAAFNEEASRHGQQAEQRERDRQQRLDEQLEKMASQQQVLLAEIAGAVQTTQQQSLLMADQHQRLLADLKQSSGAAAQSSKHMSNSASQLGLLAVNVQKAAELLGQRLEQVTQRIEDAGSQNAMLAGQLQSQAGTLQHLQKALLEGAQRFEQAASEARNGFGEMKQHQREFLAGVHSEFTRLGEMLREQVEGIEEQAEDWLRSYSKEVSTQVHERMDQWNKQTLGFANQMHAVVQAISNVVDELETDR